MLSNGRSDDGKLKRKAFYGKTKREVMEKMDKFKSDILTGNYIEKNGITIENWLNSWLNDYAIINIRVSTRVAYEGYIKNHLIPEIGNIMLVDIKGTHLQKFIGKKLEEGNRRTSQGLKPKTIKNIFNMLQKAMAQAVKNDLLLKNPCDFVQLPKIEKEEVKVLSLAEQKALLTETSKERLGIGIFIALATGMRLGEILGLCWTDIDLESETIYIRNTLNRLKNYDTNANAKTILALGKAKTKSSKRNIHISKELMKVLQKYIADTKEVKEIFGEHLGKNNFVICNEFSKPIEPRTYQEFYKKMLKNANLRDVNFHALRHTFATRALEADISVKTISEILGHSSITITLDLYGHVLENTKKDALESIGTQFLTFDEE